MTVHSFCNIVDGKKIATGLQGSLKEDVKLFTSSHGRAPALAVIQVGHNPASTVYVAHKGKACAQVAIDFCHHHLKEATQQDELISLIRALNLNPDIDGILLQLPLPSHLDSSLAIEAIDSNKDVDGLHPLNQGYLFSGHPKFVPCTPLGCLYLIKTVCPDLSGKQAVVVGRSVLVGRPMASLLLNEHATVTIAHSRTKNLRNITKAADILVVAMGAPQAIDESMVKPGAIVIDVGINRYTPPEGGADRLVGDVNFDGVKHIAAHITPVPGGVGPMTIAFLLKNTLEAAHAHAVKKRAS